MKPDSQVKKPVDLNKVDLNNIGELLWWSYHLGVSPEKLISTAGKVGNSTEEIRKYLSKPEENSH